MILEAFFVWIGIAVAETLHGIIRVKLLNRRLGDRRARLVGVFIGSCIILIIGWFSIPWIGPTTDSGSLLIGALWLVLMLGFDIALARLVFRFSWRRIALDFDITKGNLLALGMLFLFFTPLLVAKLRGLY